MSKIAELKADIPNYGDGVIINVYSSVEDMSNEYYTNDYILVEAEYDGAYHKDCPIAVTYSRTSDAFNEFGTEWVIQDANGNNCYVMTEPYFPEECIVTWARPTITLSYPYVDASGQDTITPTSVRYSQVWTDSCGNSDTEQGNVIYNTGNVATVSYTFAFLSTVTTGNYSYNIAQRTGELTINKGIIYSTANTAIGTVNIQASVHNTRSNTTSCTIWQKPTTGGTQYEVWNNTGITKGSGAGNDFTDFYIVVQSPTPSYTTPYLGSIYFCESYEEAVERNRIINVWLPNNTADANGYGTLSDGTTDHFYCQIDGNNKRIMLYDN